MTAFLQCIWMFFPNMFCLNSEPHELVWKSVWPILHRNFVSKFMIFLENFEIWNLVFIFLRLQTQENVFWGLGTFLHVFKVQYFTDLFTRLTILYKFSPVLHKSFSYEPSRQYGISPFLKHLKNRNNCKRGIGKIRIFLIELPIELPIHSAWNH